MRVYVFTLFDVVELDVDVSCVLKGSRQFVEYDSWNDMTVSMV